MISRTSGGFWFKSQRISGKRQPIQASLCCAFVLCTSPRYSLGAPTFSPRALLVLFCASPMLPCCAPLLPQFSLSRSKTAISNPKVRVYIIYIYIVSPNRGQLLMLARSCLSTSDVLWLSPFGLATIAIFESSLRFTSHPVYIYVNVHVAFYLASRLTFDLPTYLPR